MAWTGQTFNVGQILTAAQMTNLQTDITAAFEKAAGAPVLANDYVNKAMIAANVVGSSELLTTSGIVSTTSTTFVALTLAGGAYGFYPRTRSDNIGNDMTANIADAANNTSYLTQISIFITAGTGYAQQTYMQASPPYDLGDGEIPFFVFAIVNNATKKIETVYSAPEAPWHYNGKTSIVASRKDLVTGKSYKMVREVAAEIQAANMSDIKSAVDAGMFTRTQIADRLINDAMVEVEITQAIKNADMVDIPHPFTNNDLTGKTVIMLDPVATERLAALQDEGEDVNGLLHDGTIKLSSSAIARATPQDIQAFGFTL